MTLVDPTATVGYAFGEKLTSADMTTIATQQPDAWDIVNGGTYTTTGVSVVNATGGDIDITGNVEWQNTDLPLLESRTYDYAQTLLPAWSFSDRWSRASSEGVSWNQSDDLPTATLIIPLTHLPYLASITQMELYLDGNAHSDLPTVMPTLRLKQVDTTTGVISVLETQADTSNLATYNTYHAITMTVSPGILIDGTQALYAHLAGETAFSAPDIGKLVCHHLVVTCDCTKVAPG